MEKRSALQKAVLISVAAMAVAFAILTFVFHRLEGVKFEEGFLRVSAQSSAPAATVYAGKVQGERVKITVTDCPDEQRTEVEVQVGDRVHDVCAVETSSPVPAWRSPLPAPRPSAFWACPWPCVRCPRSWRSPEFPGHP